MNSKGWLIVALVTCTAVSRAEVSRLRLVATAGLADSLAKGASAGGQDRQGPLGGTAAVEYLLNGQWEIGAEHQRTWSNRSGTAIGLTGITLKNFFWYSHPQVKLDQSDLASLGYMEMRALSPYLGVGAGISQASIVDQNLNALGIYGAAKGGIEWPIQRAWGMRTEGTLASTLIGSGSIIYVSLTLGLYIHL